MRFETREARTLDRGFYEVRSRSEIVYYFYYDSNNIYLLSNKARKLTENDEIIGTNILLVERGNHLGNSFKRETTFRDFHPGIEPRDRWLVTASYVYATVDSFDVEGVITAFIEECNPSIKRKVETSISIEVRVEKELMEVEIDGIWHEAMLTDEERELIMLELVGTINPSKCIQLEDKEIVGINRIDAIRKANKWIRTDDLQFIREINETTYEIINIEEPFEGEFIFSHTEIDINNYSPSEIEETIKAFGYDDLDSLYLEHGHASNQIIAECISEVSIDEDETYQLGEVVSLLSELIGSSIEGSLNDIRDIFTEL